MRFFWGILLVGAVVTQTEAITFAEPPWPELSADAVTQLATAVDGEQPDEPAFYPLLLHMRGWDAGHASAARVGVLPEGLKVYLSDPAVYRGVPFVLEGRFAGRVRDVKLLRRGPWGETVTEWGMVQDGPKDAGDRVAIVYFPGQVDRPRNRQRVRVVGRFYKTWSDVDAAGVETTYPVFVAAPHWEPVEVGRGVPWRGMVLVVAGLAGVMWWLRRGLRKASRDKRGAKIRRGERGDIGCAVVGNALELPDDPAEALEVLAGRAGVGASEGAREGR